MCVYIVCREKNGLVRSYCCSSSRYCTKDGIFFSTHTHTRARVKLLPNRFLGGFFEICCCKWKAHTPCYRKLGNVDISQVITHKIRQKG
jgi:hypothetical protein